MLPLRISGSHLISGIIDDNIPKAHGKSVITIKVVILNTNNDCLVVKVFPRHDLEVLSSVGFVVSFQIMLKHFKIYIMITDIVGEKRIDLACACSKFWGGGRVGGLHMCHPPYHPLDFQGKIKNFGTLPS